MSAFSKIGKVITTTDWGNLLEKGKKIGNFIKKGIEYKNQASEIIEKVKEVKKKGTPVLDTMCETRIEQALNNERKERWNSLGDNDRERSLKLQSFVDRDRRLAKRKQPLSQKMLDKRSKLFDNTYEKSKKRS